VVALREAGRLEPALAVLHEAEREIAAPLPFLEKLAPASAVAVAGPLERDRVRLFAGLVAEEAFVYDELGNATSAELCARRALDLFQALSSAGVALPAEDEERRARLRQFL
jgi:hypothetical protein